MISTYKAAAVQFEPMMFEKERNVSRLLVMAREAAQSGARLIVTPEMGTTGYCWFDRAEVMPFVEAIPGPTTNRFERWPANSTVTSCSACPRSIRRRTSTTTPLS